VVEKKLPSSTRERRLLIDPKDPKVSIFKQCKYLKLHRSTYYFHPRGESAENLLLMEKIDRFHMENPALGSRMIAAEFRISRDCARRLMGLMGINAVYPVP
jgi:putative transposase